MTIEVLPVDWNDDEMVALISRLLNVSFNTTNNPSFSPDLLRWKHRDNPWGQSISYIAYDKEIGLIGLRTFLRWEFKNADGVYKAYQPVDTATSPLARGRGVFSMLTKKALSDTADGIIFNTPNKNSFPGYMKMGWNHLGYIKFSVMPRILLFCRTLPDIKSINKSTFNDNSFCNNVAKSKNLCTNKTSDYLIWRFVNIPNIEYKLLKVSESFSLIYRTKQRAGLKELMICDFIGDLDVSPTKFHLELQKLLCVEKCNYSVICFKDVPKGLEATFIRVPFKKMNFVTKSEKDFEFSLSDIEVF
ncbi:GNAT family N-acetyltransferase [Vibrio parahaemolyticus]